MADILIIGGHGKVALLLERLLAERGEQATGLIRNAEQQYDVSAAGARPLVADIQRLSTQEIGAIIGGRDAVVWSAGAGGGDPKRTYAIDRDAAIRSIDAAVATGVRRYVMVSYFGAGPDHGVPETDSFFPYADAKTAADAHLRESGLDWTIVAPSTLTLDDPTGSIDATATTSGSVSRADVAAVIAAVLADDSTIGRTIRFNSGSTPIAQAVAAG